jgi:hypothetical protein
VPANNKVFVNTQFATVTAASATSITAVVPLASSGRVTVETPNGSAVAPGDLIVARQGVAAANVIGSQRIALGQASQAATITPTTGVLVVMFDATIGQILDTFLQTNGATIAIVRGPNGAAMVQGDSTIDAGPQYASGNWFTGRFVAPQTGTYVIAVGATFSATPAVTVTPYVVPPDAATALPADGNSHQITFTAAGQRGTFTFAGTAGEKVSLLENFQSFPSCWWFGWTANPDGTYLLPPGETCTGGTWGNSPYVLSQTGTYTIRFVPEVSGSMTCCNGSIAATLWQVPPDPTATLPMDGTTLVPLGITVPGEAGDFTFSGTSAEKIALLLAFANFNSCWTHVALLNPDGTTLYGPVESCIGGGSFLGSSVFALPQTGTYTLHVAPEMGTGTVEVRGYVVPPNITTTATIGGSAASLNFTAPGEQGSITFAGTAGQPVSVLLNFSQLPSCWTHYSILNPDGSALAGTVDGCFNGSLLSSPYTLPQTGMYTITLAPDMAWNAMGTISAQLFAVPANATSSVSIGGPATQITLTTPGQQGTVTFSGTAAQQMTLHLDDSHVTSCWTFFTLRNPDGTALISRTETCSSAYSSGALTLPQTGTYTLTLAPDLSGGGATATTGTGTITVTAASGGS